MNSRRADARTLVRTEEPFAPDFALRDTRGRDVRLTDYRGRPVVIVFTRSFR